MRRAGVPIVRFAIVNQQYNDTHPPTPRANDDASTSRSLRTFSIDSTAPFNPNAFIATPPTSLEIVLSGIRDALKRKVSSTEDHQSIVQKIINHLQEAYNLTTRINTDDFISCGANGNEMNRALTHLAISTHQTASSLSLEMFELQQASTEINERIQSILESDANTSYTNFQEELIEPLKKEANDLEVRWKNVVVNQKRAQRTFQEARQLVARHVMQLVQEVNLRIDAEMSTIEDSDLLAFRRAVAVLEQRVDSSSTSGDGTPATSIPCHMLSATVIENDDPIEDSSTSALLGGESATKSLRYLQKLYQQANQIGDAQHLTRVLNTLQATCRDNGMLNVDVVVPPLKAVERTIEKAVEENNGDFSRVLDICSGSVVCGTVADLVGAIESLFLIPSDTKNSRNSSASNDTNDNDNNGHDNEYLRSSRSSTEDLFQDLEIVQVVNNLFVVPSKQSKSQHPLQSHSRKCLSVYVRLAGVGNGLVCEIQFALRSLAEINSSTSQSQQQSLVIAKQMKLLDPGWGHVRATGDGGDGQEQQQRDQMRGDLKLALGRVERGTCVSLNVHYLNLTIPECQALGLALRSRSCHVTELSLTNCGLDFQKSLAVVRAGPEESKGALFGLGTFSYVNMIGNEGISGEFVAGCVSRKLEELTLRECRMDEVESSKLCAAIKQWQPYRLHTLDLFFNSFRGKAGEALGAALLETSSITNLDLANCSLGAEEMKCIAPALSRMVFLASLNLRYNEFGGVEGSSALATALDHVTQLTSLQLWGNNLGPEGAKVLSTSLSKLAQLTKLEFCWSDIREDGAKAIAPALANLKRLKSLDLSGNILGSNGASSLCSALMRLKHVTCLELQVNGLGADGTSALRPALSCLTHLLTLKLFGNGMGAAGAISLGHAIAILPHLTELQLQENNLGADGAKALASALARLTQMKHLFLSENSLGAEGIGVLQPALTRMKHMVTLELSDNRFGAKGLDALVPALSNMPHLTNLILRGNDLDEDTKIQIRQYLSHVSRISL